ncbi:MAG TPA: pitrilysin family protein [Cyclobacteriaceae bacterium]|nr:pitrilysin family protein [Cyclobacteriaceae bacterium]
MTQQIPATKAKAFILFFIALILPAILIAQTKLVEKITRQGEEIVIPYEKYSLANGLTLIIHEDHSDPLVHVDITYHVGSAREEIGKSGFAHFFEHMMFQGSKNVADEEHFKIITESGGTLNGSTNRDRTNYYQTMPANQLETALWLESDRMGWLLDAVTQQKFEVQRATVKNEKQENYDNSPYGLYPEKSAKALYPYGHPYSWLTIGDLQDLDRVDVNDLKKFFLRWYGPNNATLTIGGDVNPQEVIRLAEKYFGIIPGGPDVQRMKLEPVKIDHDRYVSYEDANIRFPALIITLPTVPRHDPDEPALDCLSDILGTGRGSYLYKKFVETRLAIQASVINGCSELGGEFTMFVFPFPGRSLSDFEKEIESAIQEFENTGVEDEDIQKFKSRFEANMINGLATVSGKVSQLAAYETYIGNPDFIREELRRYNAVTKEEVMRVYHKYIKGKPKVVVSVLPKGQGMEPAKPDNFIPSTEGVNPYPVTDYNNLVYKEPKSSFDRSNRPEPPVAPLGQIPEYWETSFPNGIRAIGTISNEIPTLAIQLSLRGGQQLDAHNPEKAGLASITAAMMNESTANYSAEAISEELEKIGSNISIYASETHTIISVRSLAKNIGRTLEIFEEKLLRPKFDESDFERVKKQTLESLQQAEKEPVSIADLAYNKLIYGNKNILSVPVDGLVETVEKISLDDIRNFYKNFYSPVSGQLVIVGDVRQEDILKKLSFLEKWTGKKVTIPELPKSAAIAKTKIYLVDKEDAPQSEIRIGYLTNMPYDATGKYFKSSLMNYVLGGAFNSRINLNLREDKGWTYGARAYFNSGILPGPYTASAGIKGSASDSAVFEFVKELTRYSEKGITDEELTFMKKSVGQRDALRYEAPYQKAGFLNNILTYNLDKNFVSTQNKIISSITKEEINALAKELLPVEKMDIVVVGDKAKILEGLKRLNYEIVELDARGEPLEELKLERK